MTKLQAYMIDQALIRRCSGVTNPTYIHKTIEQDCLMSIRAALMDWWLDTFDHWH
jgi:hypothetical protein